MAQSVAFKRVQHVSVGRPPGSSRDEAVAFYGGVLGLPEVPVPETLDRNELAWFTVGESELHVFLEGRRTERGGQHLCLEVADAAALEALRRRLEAAGVHVEDTTPIRNRPRFFARDPFGNRLEFTAILGPYR